MGLVEREPKDLSVEIEGGDLVASNEDKWLIQALAWMGFVGPGEAEEVLDTLGLSGGNERMSRYTSFSLSAAYLPSPPPFKTQGHVDCSGWPLHQRTDLTREEYEELKNGQTMTSYSSRLNLPSTLSPGDTQI